MRPIRAGVVAVTAVAVALLGACSDEEPEAPPSPSSSTTSSPTSESPEPTPPPPPLPPEATTMDAAGAAAFVRHWFDLVNYAYATGNTDPVRAVSIPECESCSNTVATIDEQYSNGGRIEGGQIAVMGAESPAPEPDRPVLVTTVYSQEPLSSISAGGETSAESPAEENQTVGFFIEWRDDAWTAAGIGEG